MAYVFHYTLALGMMIVAAWLPGYALERSGLGLERGEPMRHLARLVLGLAAWQAVLFAAAALGFLGRGTILGLAGLGLAAVLFVSRGRLPLPAFSPSFPGALAGLALGALLLPFLLLAMSPPVSWDASTYHLTVPRLYFEHGGFRPIPMNVYSNWPLGVELFFGAALALFDHAAAKTVHFGFGLATLYGLHLGVRQAGIRSRVLPWLAVFFFLASPVVAFELRVAYVELAYAFYFLAAFLFLERARREEGAARGRFLLLAGLAAGLLAGTKLNGIVGVAVLGAVWLGELLRGGEIKAFAGRFALPAVALWVPWLVKSAVFTGNPIYPFVFGGPDWSAELGEQFRVWQSSIGRGREPLDYLLLPWRVIFEGGQGYERFDGELGTYWAVLVPLALVFGRRSWRALALAGLYFLTWALSSQQMRFLIPALAPLAMAGTLALGELAERLPERARRPALAALLATAVLLPAVGHLETLRAGYRLLELYPRAERSVLLASAMPPEMAFIERELPADARILMLNTNQGFFCRRDYLADSFFEASQIAAWLGPEAGLEEVRAKLAERGITHVLLDRRDRGIAFPPALFDLLRHPARAVFTRPDNTALLFELEPGVRP